MSSPWKQKKKTKDNGVPNNVFQSIAFWKTSSSFFKIDAWIFFTLLNKVAMRCYVFADSSIKDLGISYNTNKNQPLIGLVIEPIDW